MLPWNERLHGVGVQVIMGLVHMHEGLVRFPAVARIVESRPSDVELSSTFATAYSKDLVERANQEVMRHLRAMLFDARVHDKWS